MWPIEYRGSDPFGGPVLDEIEVLEAISLLCDAKKQGLIDYFSAHDDDLVPWDPDNPEDYLDPSAPIHTALASIKAVVDEVGLKMNIITCSLHGHPLFANGGLTNPDPIKRALARKKALRCAWIGNFLGAQGFTYWVARDGYEVATAMPFKGVNQKNPGEGPLTWIKQGLDGVCFACKHYSYSIKFGTIEPKVNEPRGVSFIALVGDALHLISTLDDPGWWGVNPEVPQHSSMACQEPLMELVRAVEAGKLPFLHLGNQIDGQFDNDFPPLLGPTNLKRTVQMFHYLAEVGWSGIVEFDCHAFRSDTAPGKQNAYQVRWNFICRCVEAYRLIEQILVPRLQADYRITHARKLMWEPRDSSHEIHGKVTSLLSRPADKDSLRDLTELKVDAGSALKSAAICGDVDMAFTLALMGVTHEELEYAVSPSTTKQPE